MRAHKQRSPSVNTLTASVNNTNVYHCPVMAVDVYNEAPFVKQQIINDVLKETNKHLTSCLAPTKEQQRNAGKQRSLLVTKATKLCDLRTY